jgi:hypothetical protein
MMAHPILGTLKVVTLVGGTIGAAVFVLEPTVQVALIGFAGVIAANLCAFGMLYFRLTRIDHNMDGINTHLRDKNEAQGAALTDAGQKLAHAEGRREGIESTEGK